MPEGPEVYKMRDLFRGNNCEIIIKPISNIKKYQLKMRGKLIKSVARGKHIYLYIDNKIILIQPLMSGIIFEKKNNTNNVRILTHEANIKPAHIYFKILLGDRELFIADPIKLLKIKVVNAEADLGPDVMNPQKGDVDKIYNKILRRRIELARVMLDQKVFAGCGNYLRAEALYHAKIPALIKCPVSRKIVEKIWSTVTDIALRIYRGKYSLQIYGKKISPDGRDIKTIMLNGRRLHYVE